MNFTLERTKQFVNDVSVDNTGDPNELVNLTVIVCKM